MVFLISQIDTHYQIKHLILFIIHLDYVSSLQVRDSIPTGSEAGQSYEYKLKSIIFRKVSAFLENELPLLSKCHFMDLDTIKSLGKAKVVGPNPTQGFFEIKEQHP